jgi:hypothetical protein
MIRHISAAIATHPSTSDLSLATQNVYIPRCTSLPMNCPNRHRSSSSSDFVPVGVHRLRSMWGIMTAHESKSRFVCLLAATATFLKSYTVWTKMHEFTAFRVGQSAGPSRPPSTKACAYGLRENHQAIGPQCNSTPSPLAPRLDLIFLLF